MRQQYNANRGYSVNGLNQYLTAGRAIPTYDARGNLTGQGTSSFTYSSENLLKSATLSSGASTLRYDPAMRLAQTSGSATTRFLYDGTDLVAEYDGAATVVLRRYVHGPGADEPLVWYEGSGTSDRRWLHADERGSIIAVTNGSGTAIGTNAYDEWGNPQSGNLGRFGYTGQTWLPEIGLWYYKARMYNPRLGRFMQTDPIGYGDGMNLYAYVGGDPINHTDPSGLSGCGSASDPCDLPPIVVTAPSSGSNSGGSGTSVSINPISVVKTVFKAAKKLFCGIFGCKKKKKAAAAPAVAEAEPQNVIPTASCRGNADAMGALSNPATQNQAQNMMDKSANYNGTGVPGEYGFVTDVQSGAVGPLFTSGQRSGILPNDFLGPNGGSVPMRPGAGAGQVFFHAHPNYSPSPISTPDQNNAKYYGWTVVAVDKAMKADCYASPGG